MQNTAVVLIERRAIHPLYKKGFVRSKKYLADDPLKTSEGDLVDIEKIKPISKMKHFRILKVIGKSMEEITAEKLKMEAKSIIAEVMPEEKESGQGTVDSEQLEEIDKKEVKERRAASSKVKKGVKE